MTDEATLVPAPEPQRETLWVTDAELIRRLGVPEKVGYETLRALDENPRTSFPAKQKIWGNRRYWPAVRAYLDAQFGLRLADSTDKRGRHV